MADDTCLTLPTFLPDGSSLYQDSDFMHRLRNGDASLGWAGDPRLGVYMADGRLEIWRLGEDGVPRCIMRSKPGHRFLNADTLRFLAEHDTRSRRAYNVVEEVLDHNRRLEQSRRDEARAASEEAADRLHHALLKDVGATAGGLTKRLHTLPPAPWKKN